MAASNSLMVWNCSFFLIASRSLAFAAWVLLDSLTWFLRVEF